MKNQIKRHHLAVLIAGLTGLGSWTQAADTSPNLTSIVVHSNLVTLTWTNGRPTYQLQTRSDSSQPWSNVGTPTSENSATLPFNAAQAFFRVVSDYTARYQVVFNATWSQTSHPTNWPANAHWSGLVGGTHKDAVHFWRPGETASEGIRLMAERGQQATLLSEIAPAITDGTAQMQLAGGGISTSPGRVTLTFPEPMQRDYPLVTLVSMIAPSPDWFAGVDSLNMIQDGQWATNLVVTLYGHDAGTDSGTTYSSPDEVTTPRGVVTRFAGFPAIQKGVIVPFGTFEFTRLD
ncbi:MAG TPA: spondin domain-containing protein [Verrucomicrobiae bacterium]|nr:spondin domain-containing protein [Verrucomicrobiae bacterium]